MGSTDIEDSLERLDKLTLEEARIATAELLKVSHSVEVTVQDVRGDVQDVRSDVQDARGDMQHVGNQVQGVDDKLDQVNRSLSLYHLFIVPSAQTSSQEITSGIAFYDGFRPQIHQSTITLRARLITTVQLNGFFKAAYLINGNPLTPFCGYTESVSYSWPLPCDDP